MVPKSLALFGLAIFVIAGAIIVSACTGTPTPTAAPAVTPSPAPTATPSPGPAAAFNQSDNNKTVSVRMGEKFNVSLEENPSTGYAWNVTVTSGLTIVNDTYLPPNTTLLGAPGTHVWRVEATGAGAQQFSGIYRRPFEPLLGNETAYVLSVNVTAPVPGA